MQIRAETRLLQAGWAATLWLLAALSFAADSGVAYGTAYAIDGGAPLYTETHRWSGVHHTVEYFRPDGGLMAVSELDFSASFVRPAYTQSYSAAAFAAPAAEFAEGARWQGDELVLFSADKQKAVDYKPPLVVSSGFYHFILEHWRELHEGQSIAFDFALPDRFSTLRLRMRPLSNGVAAMGAHADADPGWFYVRVEPASKLLSWVVKPLTVALDDQQRLMLYRGIANVRDARGDTPQVLVRYRYPERALSGAQQPEVAR